MNQRILLVAALILGFGLLGHHGESAGQDPPKKPVSAIATISAFRIS